MHGAARRVVRRHRKRVAPALPSARKLSGMESERQDVGFQRRVAGAHEALLRGRVATPAYTVGVEEGGRRARRRERRGPKNGA